MEGVVSSGLLPANRFWRGRRVLLTGHTGFKGAWLTMWLAEMGAEVYGLALDPQSDSDLFNTAQVAQRVASDVRADIREASAVKAAVASCRPQIVLHLAAQSLVRASYADPLATFATNVMGTANILEAARQASGVRAVVVVTSDKCYENREWVHPYRETDRLGGRDPYSASKAAAEIAMACWRDSYAGPHVASARAGNVIGAGDWAEERLLPDCFRAFTSSRSVELRNPHAVRPWQHVLEPLAGYLLLAERLCGDDAPAYARAWNFGPDAGSDATVGEVARMAARLWGEGAGVVEAAQEDRPHEAGQLRLDSTLARLRLGWAPRWGLPQALEATVEGYRCQARKGDLAGHVRAQIAAYCSP